MFWNKSHSHFRTEKEQELSAEWSSLVNKAYKTLMSPIQRAEYILQINNMDVVDSNTIDDKAFLMEMMERNEQVSIILNYNQFCTGVD